MAKTQAVLRSVLRSNMGFWFPCRQGKRFLCLPWNATLYSSGSHTNAAGDDGRGGDKVCQLWHMTSALSNGRGSNAKATDDESKMVTG